MGREALIAALAPLALAIALPPAGAEVRTANQTVRVSLDTGGDDPNGASFVTDISADGRLVLFQSRATDLSPEDEQGFENVFLADLDTGVVELVSTGPRAPSVGDNSSYGSSMSADGRYVVFDTRRPLDPQDDNHPYVDAYWRDRRTGRTVLVSGTADGGAGNAHAGHPQVSDDGRWVTFVADADGVVDGVAGPDVAYVRDMVDGTTTVAVRRLDGNPDRTALVVDVSRDGRFGLVLSEADDLVAGDAADDARELYLCDLRTGRTIRVGPGPAARPAADDVRYADMTPDAAVVLFHTLPVGASSADPGRLLVRDRRAGTIAEVGRGSRPSDSWTTQADLADDGRHVAFVSASTDLVDRPEWRGADVFVRDLTTGATTLVPVSRRGGAADGRSLLPFLSADGSAVAFTSYATNLALPEDENVSADVYRRKLEPPR